MLLKKIGECYIYISIRYSYKDGSWLVARGSWLVDLSGALEQGIGYEARDTGFEQDTKRRIINGFNRF